MRIILAAVLTLVTSAAFAQTDTYTTQGFGLGFHFNGTAWELDEPDLDLDGTDSGGGIGLELSYGFNKLVAIILNLDGAEIDPEVGESYGLAHADLGARFTFGADQSKLKGYAIGALSGVAAEIEVGPNTLQLRGGGVTLGGGIMYFVSHAVSLDSGLQWTFGNLNEVEINNVTIDTDITARTGRFFLGMHWFP